jgi:hypothetical protein
VNNYVIKETIVSTRVEPQLRDQLAERARDSDRTLAGEVRHALRLYVRAGSDRRDDASVVRLSGGS